MNSSLPFNYTPPADKGLDILYQDDALLVVNKAAGLLSVPGRDEDKQDCLINRVQIDYPSARIVHRLDMATSGAMVIALNDEVHRQLSILFEKRNVKKRYVAVVDGIVKDKSGLIDLPLITDWPNRPKQMIDHERGKPSRTQYQRMSVNKESNTSRVELIPETGRSHQIRVHLQSLGHAILGDRLYASKEVIEKADRLLLHSTLLSFEHPVTGELLEVTSVTPF